VVEEVLENLPASNSRWAIGVLRYFNPVGPHPSGLIGADPRGEPANLIPYAMQVALGRREALSVFGADYQTPDGTGVRDHVHVMDLAKGHLAVLEYLEYRTEYRIWNLGTGLGN
jgi:UDP-glucose 4-epimerase